MMHMNFGTKLFFIEIQGHRLMPNTIFASKSSRQGIFRKANGPFGLGLLEAQSKLGLAQPKPGWQCVKGIRATSQGSNERATTSKDLGVRLFWNYLVNIVPLVIFFRRNLLSHVRLGVQISGYKQQTLRFYKEHITHQYNFFLASRQTLGVRVEYNLSYSSMNRAASVMSDLQFTRPYQIG